MKPAALFSVLILLIGSAAQSQWRFLPQIGIETLRSTVDVNGKEAISSLSGNAAFKGTLRTDYLFKGGHGPYASIGSSPGAINLNFDKPESIASNYTKETGGLQWRLEGGYGLTTKPIYFKKGASKTTAKTNTATKSYTTVVKKSCGSYITYHCQRAKTTPAPTKNTALNLRLQPSVGIAYLPGVKDDIVQEGNAYTYRAGNWNTAFVSSLGFELAKGTQRFLTLQVSYTKGIGNLDSRSITTVTDAKTAVTSLQSTASAWALTAGVPLSFNKKTTTKAVQRASQKTSEKCRSYYKSCHRTVI